MRKRLSAVSIWVWLAGAAVLIAAVAVVGVATRPRPSSPAPSGLVANFDLDPGTPLDAPAPNFTLTDELGRQVSLRSFRGRVVILGFADSKCTTVCPLTTAAMVAAKRMLGAAGSQVQLLGVNANPAATSIRDVRTYSSLHGMLGKWRFLTGSRAQLQHVWKAYHVAAEIQAGQIDHTPALYVIDPAGRERKLYLTVMAYDAVSQLGQLLAQEASRLLPGHPRVHSSLSYSQIPGISPATRTVAPRAGGGTVKLGASGRPRLYLFFATWDQQVSDLSKQMDALNRYATAAARERLAALTAVDEGSVEPSPHALERFRNGLTHPLSYPVAVDQSGRIADGYEVQDSPWYVLISGKGKFLWYYDISVGGWPSTPELIARVQAALAHAGKPPTDAAIGQELTDSPAPLAALHQQASLLLGHQSAFNTRLHALRGYPVVINAWASWCIPCRKEFGLFALASARYGRRVAFLGANTEDSPGDAHAFLIQHPVSYPSYQTTTSGLRPLAPIAGLPTTIFINPAGKVVYVHTGQYETQGTLDQDIQTYALGG
jgi:cytochrome oxidase Cu insertion factor (SCO1/SenC/PrrC family)/thiol-disulfide isomerase/thioredoxin